MKQNAYGFHELISGWLKDHRFKTPDTDGVTFMKEVKKAVGTTSKIILTIHARWSRISKIAPSECHRKNTATTC